MRLDPTAPDPASTATIVRSTFVNSLDGVWRWDDGGIWFANTGASSIGRLDPDAEDPRGTVETFGDTSLLKEPFDIKDGPGGWLWFTDKSLGSLGRIIAGR